MWHAWPCGNFLLLVSHVPCIEMSFSMLCGRLLSTFHAGVDEITLVSHPDAVAPSDGSVQIHSFVDPLKGGVCGGGADPDMGRIGLRGSWEGSSLLVRHCNCGGRESVSPTMWCMRACLQAVATTCSSPSCLWMHDGRSCTTPMSWVGGGEARHVAHVLPWFEQTFISCPRHACRCGLVKCAE